jgi:hypothetical protein
VRELISAANEAVTTSRQDIEKLAETLAERISLNADEVRHLIGDTHLGPVRHEEIASRAYELFERRGRIHGRDLDDWLQAERDLRGK